MLSSAAHSKAALVAQHLPGVMPRVYAQTVINESLIRTVDLGPFKHKIDDGLELRKAAFECMDVLLDTCADRLDIPAFLAHLESGLKVCLLLMGWCAAWRRQPAACATQQHATTLLQQGGPPVMRVAQDHYDVKLSCHLLLAKLAGAAPGQLLAALDRLVEPLEKTLTFRLKSESVKQEVHCVSAREPEP